MTGHLIVSPKTFDAIMASPISKTEGFMRTFDTGATRDADTTKPDYEGFLSPLVIKRYGEYMHRHRKQADGQLRASDNWQKGIPREQYLKSAYRHFLDVLLIMDGCPQLAVEQDLEEALSAMKFNIDGLLHETIKVRLAKADQVFGPAGYVPTIRVTVSPRFTVKQDVNGVWYIAGSRKDFQEVRAKDTFWHITDLDNEACEPRMPFGKDGETWCRQVCAALNEGVYVYREVCRR